MILFTKWLQVYYREFLLFLFLNLLENETRLELVNLDKIYQDGDRPIKRLGVKIPKPIEQIKI